MDRFRSFGFETVGVDGIMVLLVVDCYFGPNFKMVITRARGCCVLAM